MYNITNWGLTGNLIGQRSNRWLRLVIIDGAKDATETFDSPWSKWQLVRTCGENL